jgi:hypothetical protein
MTDKTPLKACVQSDGEMFCDTHDKPWGTCAQEREEGIIRSTHHKDGTIESHHHPKPEGEETRRDALTGCASLNESGASVADKPLEAVKDHHDILRMVRDLAADDARDHYVKQVAGSAENLIDALAAAIRDQRERDAKIAEGLRIYSCSCASEIAAAIRADTGDGK